MNKKKQNFSKTVFVICRAFKKIYKSFKITAFRLYLISRDLIFNYISINPERRKIKMPAPYRGIEQVQEDIQPILDEAAERDNGIDGIALILYGQILMISRKDGFGGKFDTTVASSLFDGFEESLKGSFGIGSSLKQIHFLKSEQNTLNAWTIVVISLPNFVFQLVFAGAFKDSQANKFSTHIGASKAYTDRLLPLITSYSKFI